MARRMARVRLLLVVAAVPLLLWGVLPVLSEGEGLKGKIETKKRQIEAKKGRERVLTSDIEAMTARIDALQADITRLQGRQIRLEADLSVKRTELARIQDDLRRERIRLARLRARLAHDRTVLAARLVALYKADKPDMVTVILEADGFAEMLERTEFMQRVSEQDARIIERVRAAKAASAAAAKRLDALEERQRRITAAVAARRDEVVAVKGTLEVRRESFAGARAEKQTVLAGVRVASPRAGGRPARPRGRGGAHPGPAGRRHGPRRHHRGGPDPAGLGPAHLARRRADRLRLRHALGPPARRRGHRRPRGHADPRGRLGHRRAARLDRRLRQLHVHRPRRRPVDVLRAPVELRHVRRGERRQRPGDRLRRLHGPLLRRPPALRDARRRRRPSTRWATCKRLRRPAAACAAPSAAAPRAAVGAPCRATSL